MRHRIKYISLAALVAFNLLVSACSKEIEDKVDIREPNNDDVRVTLSLAIPPSMAATRGLSPLQEEEIKNVDILVFDQNLVLSDWQYGTIKSTDATGVSFTALLKASKDDDDKFRIMVLANVREKTYRLFRGDNFGNMQGVKTYAEICALLQDAVPTKSGIASEGLPLWGELKDLVLVNNSSPQYNLTLIRSLARIDVGTNPIPAFDNTTGEAEYEVLDNFSLERVYVYNPNEEYLIPAKRDEFDFTNNIVNKPSLPGGNTKDDTPWLYSDDVEAQTVTRDNNKGVCVTSAIYTGEAGVKMGDSGVYGDANHENRMAVVVAGYYSDDPQSPNTSTLSYYRIDFTEGLNGTSLMDIRRNHVYQVVIRSVNGPGSSTPDEAFKKFNAEIEASVVTWVPSSQGNTVADGQNYLSVSEFDFAMGKWAAPDTRFTITTNLSNWSAKILNPADTWIKLHNAFTGIVSPTITGASGEELRFSVEEIPAATTERTAKIRITAGTMSLDVFVKQTSDDQAFMLRLSTSEMDFIGRKWNETTLAWEDPDPQELRISYGPTLHKYRMNLTAYSGGGISSSLTLPDPPESDASDINIELDAIDPNSDEVKADPFYVRSSRLGFRVQNVDGSDFINKQVVIRQTFYSLLIGGTFDYYMQGESYTLTIRSNSAWTAEYSGDESIFESRSGNSGSGVTTSTGEKLTFKIKGNATPSAEAFITFKSPTNLFPPQTIRISAQDMLPNSYMVTPGGTVEIPIRKAYRVWALDRDLEVDLKTLPGAREVQLVWQDTWDGTKGIVQSLGSLTSLTGQEEDATFTVSTHNIAPGGNAVVAFTIGGEIYWSWHIWVTDYDPTTQNQTHNGHTLMDRNLGAMGHLPPENTSDVRSHGLQYQGARKDPWLEAQGLSGAAQTTSRPYYDMNGNELSITKENAPPGINLKNVIQNPMIYYKGSYGTASSWYGAFVPTRTDFWIFKTHLKADYDPCPQGWRIPPNTLIASFYKPVSATYGVHIGASSIYFPVTSNLTTLGNLTAYGEAIIWSTVLNRPATSYNLLTTGIVGWGNEPARSYRVRCVKE